MGTSRIEQIIDLIYDYVDNCRTKALSTDKAIVEKEKLNNLLDELRLRTPDEIKRYQKIIANRDAIINDAETKAQTMLAEAGEKAKNMISDHEIMQQAYLQANELVSAANDEALKIRDKAKEESDELLKQSRESATQMLDSAKEESQQVRSESYKYANDLLAMIDKIVSDTLNASKNNYDALHNALDKSLSIVRENREQMNTDKNVDTGNRVNNDKNNDRAYDRSTDRKNKDRKNK